MLPYTLVVFAHIAAAMLLVGGSVLAAPGVRAAVRRARRVEDVSASLAVGRPLQMVTPVAALLVLVTGIYLTSVGRWWNLGWVQVAVALWVLNSVTARAVVEPAVHRLTVQAASDPDGIVGERVDMLRWSARWSFGGDLLLANDSAVLCLMAVKPGLAGSVLVVALANAVVLATGAALRRSHIPGARQPGPPPLAHARES